MVGVLALAGAGAALYETAAWVNQIDERRAWWAWTLAERARRGKPVLVVGYRVPWKTALLGTPPNPDQPGDVVLDLDPVVTTLPNGVQGDVRQMPFFAKQFSVCLIEHVAEHLRTVEDYRRAVAEGARVAQVCVVITPPRMTLYNTLNSEHRLDIEVIGNRAVIHERATGRVEAA